MLTARMLNKVHCIIDAPPMSTGFMQIVRNMPGFKKWVGRALKFEPSGANIEYLRETIPDLNYDDTVGPALDAYAKVQEAGRLTLAQKNGTLGSKPSGYRFKTKPFRHQFKAFMLSRALPVFALLMEMGTGKSKVLIDTAAYLFEAGEIDALIIVAPNGVHTNWLDQEIPKHMPARINKSMAAWSSTKRGIKSYQRKLDALCEFKGLAILAVNVEALSHERPAAFVEEFIRARQGRVLFAIDESTRIKKSGVERTKTCIALGLMCTYRRILTGQPVTQGAEDLYSQFEFLDPNVLGFNSFYTFRNRYCIMGGFEMKQIVAYQRLEELQAKIDAHSFRVLKKDCLDLPERTYQSVFVDLTDYQRELYEKLKKELVILVNGHEITTPLAITKMLRLQQIVCGHLPDEKKGSYQWIVDPATHPRMEKVREIISELPKGTKTVVWARFRPDISGLRDYLQASGIRAVTYYGDDSTTQRRSAQLALQEGDAEVLIGNPHSGGIGIDLTAASVCVYYSNDFSLEARDQSEARLHRSGQRNPVTYIDIEAIGTMDKYISKALKEKRDVADLINKDNIEDIL